jgi:hypothetical protein
MSPFEAYILWIQWIYGQSDDTRSHLSLTLPQANWKSHTVARHSHHRRTAQAHPTSPRHAASRAQTPARPSPQSGDGPLRLMTPCLCTINFGEMIKRTAWEPPCTGRGREQTYVQFRSLHAPRHGGRRSRASDCSLSRRRARHSRRGSRPHTHSARGAGSVSGAGPLPAVPRTRAVWSAPRSTGACEQPLTRGLRIG